MASLRLVPSCRRDSGRSKHEAFLFWDELLLWPVVQALVSTSMARACLEVLAPIQLSHWVLARWQRAKLRLALSHRPGLANLEIRQRVAQGRQHAHRYLKAGMARPSPQSTEAH